MAECWDTKPVLISTNETMVYRIDNELKQVLYLVFCKCYVRYMLSMISTSIANVWGSKVNMSTKCTHTCQTGVHPGSTQHCTICLITGQQSNCARHGDEYYLINLTLHCYITCSQVYNSIVIICMQTSYTVCELTIKLIHIILLETNAIKYNCID